MKGSMGSLLNEITSASSEASLKLLSQAMLDELVKQGQHADVKDLLKGLNIRLLIVATDCPGNEDRQCNLAIEEGKVTKAESTIEPAPSDMRDLPFDKLQLDAKVISPFGPLADLILGRMSFLAAVEHIKIEGDLLKLMIQVDEFVAFLKLIRAMPVDWAT